MIRHEFALGQMMIKHEFDSSLKWNRWFLFTLKFCTAPWSFVQPCLSPWFPHCLFLFRPFSPTLFWLSVYIWRNISLFLFLAPPLCLIFHFLQFPNPPFLFVLLNSPAVCVASGLVFCGSIGGVCASFMLWMALDAGFTAPAVMPQHFSLSCLAVKWSKGPLGQATPWTLLLKALSWPTATD